MEGLLAFITAVCAKIQVVSDLFWDFPTNFKWYSSLPVLGNFSEGTGDVCFSGGRVSNA